MKIYHNPTIVILTTIVFWEMSNPFQLRFTFKDILYDINLYSKIIYIPNINQLQILMLIKIRYLPYQNGRSILRPYHLYQDVRVNILKALSFELNQEVEVYLNRTIICLEISSSFQLKCTFKDILYSICLHYIYLYSLISYSFFIKSTSTMSLVQTLKK